MYLFGPLCSNCGVMSSSMRAYDWKTSFSSPSTIADHTCFMPATVPFGMKPDFTVRSLFATATSNL